MTFIIVFVLFFTLSLNLGGRIEYLESSFHQFRSLRNPYYVDAYHALGVLYRITKRNNEALPMFQKAVELNQNLWQGQRNSTLIYMERKEYEKGLRSYFKGD